MADWQPESVDISGRDVEVRRVEGLQKATGDQAAASDEDWIAIDPTRSHRRQAEDMVHELAHHFGWALGISLRERRVIQIERLIVGFIRHNARLCRWIIDGIAGKERRKR